MTGAGPGRTTYRLRPVREDDTAAVLDAFASAPDMARQGEVPDHRGRGVAARGTATVAHWALGGGGLERLELGHRVNNPESGVVARAAGFVLEGRERGKFLIDGERIDVLTYGRLRSDPDPAPRALPLEVSPAWRSPTGRRTR